MTFEVEASALWIRTAETPCGTTTVKHFAYVNAPRDEFRASCLNVRDDKVDTLCAAVI